MADAPPARDPTSPVAPPAPGLRRGGGIAAWVVIAAVFIAAPVYGSAYTVQLATDILTFTALAYGWNLISGFTGYLSFGQVSFYGVGAYVTGVLVVHSSIPWYLAVCAGGALAMVAAILLGPIMLRVRGILFALSMFGLARIFAVLFSDWDYAGGGNGLTLPAVLTPVGVYVFAGALALAGFGLNAWFAGSGFGLDAMGIREDENAAAAVGVPTTRVKVVAFALSAVLAGLAGGLVAWNRSYIDPPSVFDPTIDLQTVVFVLFGGMGTLWGPFIGTAILTIVGEQLLVHFPNLELALYGLVVIGTVLLLPGGIVSLANRWGWLRRPIVLAPRVLPPAEPPPRGAAPEQGGSAQGGPVLEVDGLGVRFGGLVALDGVTFSIAPGETIAIIGANGAGKTTLFNAITGFVPPSSGDIRLRGRSVGRLPAFRRARGGMARTFQIPRLMRPMTVWENVLAAARHGRQGHRAVAQAAWAVHTVGLADLWLAPVSRLSPGHQRRLEFGRVLALDPDLVLLDEVMAGMTRDEQEEMRAVIRQLHSFGVTAVAMVEHVIAAIADLSDRMVVLDFGRKIAEGTPDEVLRDPAVIRAYLGEPGEAGPPESGGQSPTAPAGSHGKTVLAVEGLEAGYGPLTILNGLSLELRESEVVAVLGANGAGKTTLFRAIAGLLAPRAGDIRLFGEPIGGRAAHLVTRAGIGHVPSGRELFPRLTVGDHLDLGGRLCPPERRAILRERVFGLFPVLAERLTQRAGSLSGGEQQMVAIARALMTDPRVLLLDEPSTGLAPKIVLAVFEALPMLRAQGVSVLLAEQSLTLGLSSADRAYVLDHGRIVLSGSAAELASDQRVMDTYLGR